MTYMYKVSNRNELLCIGISWNPADRIAEHYDTQDAFGIAIHRNLPYSWDWRVEYEYWDESCPASTAGGRAWMRKNEGLLIHRLNPKYNVSCNTQ